MDELKDEFDELDKLNCKFDGLDTLNDELDELDKLNCKFDELDNLKVSSISWISLRMSLMSLIS